MAGGSVATALEIEADLVCAGDVCEIGTSPITLLGAAFGEPLEIDVVFSHLEYIQLLSGDGRETPTLDVEFAVSNSPSSDLPIAFHAVLDLTDRHGNLITEGLVDNSGTVNPGIINITFNPLINLRPIRVYGLHIRVDTECLGTRGTCSTFGFRAGRDNINGPIRFNEAAKYVRAMLGDADENGLLEVNDINLIAEKMGTDDPTCDLNGDRRVDEVDHRIWVKELKGTWFGDANLDREFNSSDMVQVLRAGKYETRVDTGWEEGDFNGDGDFNSSDLVVAFVDGGYERGLQTVAATVPEPSALWLLTVGWIFGLGRRRHRP